MEAATYTTAMRAMFSVCVVALLLAVAVYLHVSTPRHRGKLALAVLLTIIAFEDLVLVMRYVQWSPTLMLVESETTYTSWPRTTGFFLFHDMQVLHNLALVGFLALYPRPVRWRSWHGLAVGLPAAMFLTGALLWRLAPEALFSDFPGSTNLRTFAYWWTLRDGYAGIWVVPMVLSALVRAREGSANEARAAYVLLPLLVAHRWSWGLQWAVEFPLFALGLPNGFWVENFPPGWTFEQAVGFHAAFQLANLSVVGITVYLAASRRSYAAAGLLAFTWVVAQVLRYSTADWWSLWFLFPPLAAMYVTSRFGVLGNPRAPPWLHGLVGVLTFVALFLMVNATVFTISLDPFVQTVGVVTGLLIGAAGAAMVLPSGRALLFGTGEGDDTQHRLSAYRAAMQDALRQGLQGDDLSERLRALRAELGVSDRDHAVMELTFRAALSPAGHARALEPGSRFLNRYLVERCLGQGGAGATWLCRDGQVDRPVVVKTLHGEGGAEGIQAVLREARAIGAVRHPHVVTLYDVERVGDEAFTVMEYLEGGSLADRARDGGLDRGAFRTVAGDLLDGLAAVHAAGLLHRDVKPSNVLLTSDGRAKLGDFGIAHIPGFESTMLPRGRGVAVGTIRFMSPEQARGRNLTAASDLYSAAATLYEAWTGKPWLAPARDESAAELQMRAAQGRPFRGDAAVPAGLRPWFARALDPDPARRFRTAEEMRGALLAALDGPVGGSAARPADHRAAAREGPGAPP